MLPTDILNIVSSFLLSKDFIQLKKTCNYLNSIKCNLHFVVCKRYRRLENVNSVIIMYNGKLPKVKHIKLGYFIKFVKFPEIVETIKLGAGYSHILPNYLNLKKLELGFHYHFTLPCFPNLEYLEIYSHRNALPNFPNLKTLKINYTYYYDLPNFPNLEFLELYQYKRKLPDFPKLKFLKMN